MEKKTKVKANNAIGNSKTIPKPQCPNSERKHTVKDVSVPQSQSQPRKWIEKDKQLKSKAGRLAPEEEVKITEALCEYAFESQLTGEELLSLITDKQTKSESSIWPKVSECLPERSVQSIHNFCHRKFHPFNYKGGWTELEIKKLLVLVKEYGKKWETIGKTLERTATNVKDKFKEIGGFNYQTVVKDSNLGLRLKLLKAIDYLVDDSSHIFKHIYKFASTLDKDVGVLFTIDESANKFLIDSSLKEEKSRVIIRNIFKMLLDFDAISKVYERKTEISWSAVSDRLKFYSAEDCRKEWYKFLKEFNIEERCVLKKDRKMIKNRIIDMGVESIDDINWELIRNKRKPDENRSALENYIKVIDIYNVKPFGEVLLAIQEEIATSLGKGEDDSEAKAFKRELKERNNRNIIHVYNNFLKKKRKRS